jgi:all-beta uncharacterized protein
MVKSFSVATLFALVATAASAQTVDPRYLQFTASADHYAVANGQPVVAGYQMAWYQNGAAAPFQVNELGKPVPDANGTVIVDLATLGSTPTAGIIYEARVAAVGPTGTGVSGDSNQFTFSGPCTYQVTPTNVAAAAAGGQGPLTLTAGATCAWTATANDPWLALNVASGSGNATVTLTIAANPNQTARTGSVTVAGVVVTVSQDAAAAPAPAPAPCTYALSAASATFTMAGGTGTVTLTTGSACTWTAVSNQSWLTVNPTSGTGSKTLTYTVAKYNGAAKRTATLTIGGQILTVTESGKK